MSADELQQVDRGRVRASTDAAERLTPAYALELPPRETSNFRFTQPVALVVVGSECTVVVADAADRALHFFSGSNGEYTTSTYLGGRDSSIVRQINSIASYGETIAVGDITGPAVVLVSASDRTVRRVRLSGTGSFGLTARLGLWQGNRILERALPVPGSSRDAVVRMWDSTGKLMRELGAEKHYENESLHLAMNDGALAVHRDTVWYARFSDGRIFGYALGASVMQQPVTIELPLFYEMDAPSFIETRPSTGDQGGFLPAQVQYHLRAFAVDEEGRFWTVQMKQNGTSAILSLDRQGGGHRVYETTERVRAITARGGAVFAVVAPSAPTDRSRILAFKSPSHNYGACTVASSSAHPRLAQ